MDLLKIKFVNMEKRFDRLKSFVLEMHNHGIEDYERFNAIDGSKLVLSNHDNINNDIKKLFSNNKFEWRGGIMGCTLSHYLLWRELIISNYKYYLVLEDDVVLAHDFKNILEKIKDIISNCDYPFVYLGYSTDPKLENNVVNLPNLVFSTLINKSVMWGGTFAYIIHRDTAKKFVYEIETNGVVDPIDVFIMGHGGLHESIPQLAKSPVMTIYNETDSDIQYDILNMFDNFVFIRGVDSIGCDIKGVGRLPLKNLIIVANETENCVAFNSYGYLKYEIVSPKEFVKPQGNPQKKDGIYIKIVKLEDYDFYPCLDSEGYNMDKYLDINLVNLENLEKDLDKLKELAKSDMNCIAFNTLGQLKYAITNPKDFVLISGKKYSDIDKSEGLYVKKTGLEVVVNEDKSVVIKSVGNYNYNYFYN
jgi:GR25 family glycosyltransferase involved in LPS biosynthesis